MPQIPVVDLGQPEIRPQEQVHFDPVTPAKPQPGIGIQLAQALSSLKPGIDAYLQHRHQEYDQQQINAAKQYALETAHQDIKDVREGKQYAQASTLFQQTFDQMSGQLRGQELAAEAEKQYAEQGLGNTTDPKAFQNFYSGFVKTNTEGVQNQDYLTGMLGALKAYGQNKEAQNAAQVSHNVQTGIVNTATSLVGNAIDKAVHDAFTNGTHEVNVQNILQSISTNDRRLQFLQFQGSAVRKAITDVVVNKALQYPGMGILSVMNGKLTTAKGTKVPLSNAYWNTNKAHFENLESSKQWSDEIHVQELEDRQKKRQLEDGKTQILTELAKNPYMTLHPGKLDQVAPGLGSWAMSQQSKMQSLHNSHSVQTSYAAALPFIEDPTNTGKLTAAIDSGHIGPHMATLLIEMNRKVIEHNRSNPNKTWDDIKESPAIHPWINQLKNAADDPLVASLMKNPQALSEAEATFNLRVMNYATSHHINLDSTEGEAKLGQYAAEAFSQVAKQYNIDLKKAFEQAAHDTAKSSNPYG